MADPKSVNKWNFSDVGKWLNQQGFDDSIKDKFIAERIDGNALLELTTHDIDQLLHNNHSVDIRGKVSSIIRKLQSHLQKTNRHIEQQKNPKKRKRYHICNYNDSSNYLFDDYESYSLANNYNNNYKKKIKRRIIKCVSNSVSSKDSSSNTNNSTTDNNSEEIKNIQKRNVEQFNMVNNSNITNNHNVNNENEEVSNDEKEDINEKQKECKKNYKGYSNDHKHCITNRGKRWIENDLELMWGLHKKGFSNLKLAEHFKRTECGIMVQVDKRYKELREKQQMKEIVNYRRKRIEQLYNKSNELSDDEETENDDLSSDDDDELIINRIHRK